MSLKLYYRLKTMNASLTNRIEDKLCRLWPWNDEVVGNETWGFTGNERWGFIEEGNSRFKTAFLDSLIEVMQEFPGVTVKVEHVSVDEARGHVLHNTYIRDGKYIVQDMEVFDDPFEKGSFQGESNSSFREAPSW